MMKKTICILLGCLLATLAGAQERELLRIYTDKNCYLTGEDLWVKVCVDASLLPGNELSRVAYVEVCDAGQIHAQGKVELTDGMGWARIRFPQTMHSGVYQLTAYTRYMRNFSPDCYPKKMLAVLNAVQAADDDALLPNDTSVVAPAKAATSDILSTDKSSYRTRSKVVLSGLDRLKHVSELTLSVARKDCEVLLPDAPAARFSGRPAGKYVAECEGHIVEGRVVDGDKTLPARLACVGRTVHLFDGRPQGDGNHLFFTSGVTDRQDIVLSTVSQEAENARLEIVSPFAEVLPEHLPALRCRYDEQQLIERSIGAQLQQVMPADSLVSPLSHTLFGTEPNHSYNFDEYVRFNTFRECLIEFVLGIRMDKSGGKTQLKTLQESTGLFYRQKALVLLDGVPVDDHDALLLFNARLIHYLHQYRGIYTFGGKTYGGVISIITHRGAFSGMRTDANAQMFAYEFPQARPSLDIPGYDLPQRVLSRMPDFRHTLCWMPLLPADADEVSFYTSDLKGTFVVTLQGLLPDGSRAAWQCEFQVQ